MLLLPPLLPWTWLRCSVDHRHLQERDWQHRMLTFTWRMELLSFLASACPRTKLRLNFSRYAGSKHGEAAKVRHSDFLPAPPPHLDLIQLIQILLRRLLAGLWTEVWLNVKAPFCLPYRYILSDTRCSHTDVFCSRRGHKTSSAR